jgi:hypothetical protein
MLEKRLHTHEAAALPMHHLYIVSCTTGCLQPALPFSASATWYLPQLFIVNVQPLIRIYRHTYGASVCVWRRGLETPVYQLQTHSVLKSGLNQQKESVPSKIVQDTGLMQIC